MATNIIKLKASKGNSVIEVSVNAVSSNNSAVVSIVKLLTSAIVLVPIFITPEIPVCVASVIYPYLFLF